MSTLLTVAVALLVFGILIFIHEFGHYIFARIFKVKINQFSIGMGPKLLWYDSKKTGIRYSLSMLPIGGYVAMAGEDDESDDPNSFDKKPAWQRFIITAAGAAVNMIAGFLAIAILTTMIPLGNTTVTRFADVDSGDSFSATSNAEGKLEVGDDIIRVDGKRVWTHDALSYEIMRKGINPVDITVIRDGKTVTLEDVVFPVTEDSGQKFGVRDFAIGYDEKSVGGVISHSWHRACLTVRMCWEAIYDLFTGRFTFAAVSGPVGISSAIGDAVREDIVSVLHIVGIISINLGFMNLLPIPALDGGRLLTILAEMITGKRIPKKVEGMINTVGLMALLLLSFVIMIKDVIQLII